MAQRKLTRKQIAAGFGGKAAQAAVRRRAPTRRARKSPMAKKSRASRVRSAVRSRFNRASGKKALTRTGAGALASYAPQVAGDFGPGLALTAVGMVTNDEPVTAMGEVALGAALARRLGGAAGFAPPSGGSGLI